MTISASEIMHKQNICCFDKYILLFYKQSACLTDLEHIACFIG